VSNEESPRTPLTPSQTCYRSQARARRHKLDTEAQKGGCRASPIAWLDGPRDVRFWHKADIGDRSSDSCPEAQDRLTADGLASPVPAAFLPRESV